MCRIIVYFIVFLNLFQSCQSNNNNHIAYNIPDPDCTGVFNLCTDTDKERLGRLAIKAIHEQMDDDKDGMIEASESSDFIKEELQSNADAIRHRRFQNADLQITFNDLWVQWHHSAVYNWTTDDVVNWLVNYVHLPMYVENFRRNQFDGRMIPRLAANEKHYLSNVMQIRDLRLKRRLIIKATDVVLFGPPQNTHNLIKDVILMSALCLSFAACAYAFVRHRKTQESMKVMLNELESLQQAEGDLASVTGKIKAIENELKDKTKVDRGLLSAWFVEVQNSKDEADRFRKHRGSIVDQDKQLRLAIQEIEQLRVALRKAEEHAQHQSYDPPGELIDLLKRTYHLEDIAFDTKRKSAENSMVAAKEQMNKISKMQRGFLGAVRITHSDCMDNISDLINTAKERLAEVHHEYEERERRWNRIAALLDREDLISSSSSSTTAIGGSQYTSGTTNIAINNGIAPTISPDASSRSKQVSVDSTSLISTNSDSLIVNKTNNVINTRGTSINSIHPTHVSQQDAISSIDTGFDNPNPRSPTLKRRTVASNVLTNSRPVTDRLGNSSAILYSSSTNGLYDNNMSSTGLIRQDTTDSFELPSLARQTKLSLDTISDLQMDNNEFASDGRRSSKGDALSDDQQSVSSSGKSRKQALSNKLFRPFQNMRLKKGGI